MFANIKKYFYFKKLFADFKNCLDFFLWFQKIFMNFKRSSQISKEVLDLKKITNLKNIQAIQNIFMNLKFQEYL